MTLTTSTTNSLAMLKTSEAQNCDDIRYKNEEHNKAEAFLVIRKSTGDKDD